eukprot:scaffold140_cov247-Pinguiococcus_pyrenoidosus.AAC.19
MDSIPGGSTLFGVTFPLPWLLFVVGIVVVLAVAVGCCCWKRRSRNPDGTRKGKKRKKRDQDGDLIGDLHEMREDYLSDSSDEELITPYKAREESVQEVQYEPGEAEVELLKLVGMIGGDLALLRAIDTELRKPLQAAIPERRAEKLFYEWDAIVKAHTELHRELSHARHRNRSSLRALLLRLNIFGNTAMKIYRKYLSKFAGAISKQL